MKPLAFILAIYIFALNLAPCEDFNVPDNDAKTEISQAINNNHEHQDSDVCSPFCICQCCHTTATYFQFSDIKPNVIHISTQDFFYLNGTEKDFTTSILQPPQV